MSHPLHDLGHLIKYRWWRHEYKLHVRTFISHTFLLSRPGIASSTGIIKIAIMSIEKIFKDSTKLKRIRKKEMKTQFLFVFPDV